MCTTRQPVTITSTNRVQGDLSPTRFEESQAEQRPETTVVTAKEPESQVNLYMTSTEGEVEGSGEGQPELREGHDERLHFLGSLGESVLERGGG